MNLLDKAKQYANGLEIITGLFGPSGETVSQELAQARTDCCLKCKANTQGVKFIPQVAAAIKKALEITKDLELKTKGMEGLGTCSVCSCDLKLKTFVKIETVRKHFLLGERDELRAANPECWQISEP